MIFDAVRIIKRGFSDLLGRFGVGITGFKNLRILQEKENLLASIESKISIFQNLYTTDPELFDWNLFGNVSLLDLIRNSKSQLGQDLVALAVNSYKKSGYFVEFGATNGINNSNTFLLENSFDWQGILCEPAKSWRIDLIRNRKASLDFKCVWSSSGENLEFNETKNTELSTISKFSSLDLHYDSRNSGIKYFVETISLNDLLESHQAPKTIEYLSIDTEGSEYEILKEFNFEVYRCNFVSVEHNYGSNRERIFELLLNHGYQRIYSNHSRFDDWYVHNSLLKAKSLI